MSLPVLLQQMGVIFILAGIGFALQKKKIIDEAASARLSALVVDVCNPALILSSILSGGITATHKDLLNAILLGAVFYTVLVILGFIMPYILRSKPENRRFYNLMTVYSNVGFLGIPLAKAILPPNAILYVIVINVFYSLLFYTHGFLILGGGREGEKKHPLLRVLNPGTVMALFSLVVFWFDLKLPLILSGTVIHIGNATVFLSMTLLGVSVARFRLGDALKDLRIWAYILLRMLLFPAAVALILRAVSFDESTTLALCLMGAVPVGTLPLIRAEKIGEDTKILSSGVALTTAVSLFTITLLMAVFR
ncbi:MAG: AEC family transporter [Lachnospiraceae bacterium]|nr:AEC family transporter [Lachnospiraceae bacterium]